MHRDQGSPHSFRQRFVIQAADDPDSFRSTKARFQLSDRFEKRLSRSNPPRCRSACECSGLRPNAGGSLRSLTNHLPLLPIEFGDTFDFSGADFRKWCGEVGFKRFEVIHLASAHSAAVTYK
jgi:hypothetical protein